MTLYKIRKLLTSGVYNPTYVEVPQNVSIGHIFDENQTVIWNRKKAAAQIEMRKSAIAANCAAEADASRRFEKDVITALQDEYNFKESQAILIYNRAYESGHSNGYYEVLFYAEDLADFCEKIFTAN